MKHAKNLSPSSPRSGEGRPRLHHGHGLRSSTSPEALTIPSFGRPSPLRGGEGEGFFIRPAHWPWSILVTIMAIATTGVAQQPETAKPDEVLKAEALFRDGKIDDALRQLQEAVKKHPQLPPA